MFRKRRPRYRYKRKAVWPRSKRYRYRVPLEYHLSKIAILLVIVAMVLFMIKGKKTRPISKDLEEVITAFEIFPEETGRIFEEAKNNNKDLADLFATSILKKENGFWASLKTKRAHKEAVACYKQFILDLEGFPVAKDYQYAYENSWCSERTYGGNRKHYGTDIMDSQNQRGSIPVVSMSKGVVENIGWNDTGGYRVGIRSKNGAYLYYAHLDQYAPKIKKGTKVETGDLLGYMGDSGYGKEGTVGEFPVHLHIGIATKAFGSKETWINPYYILKYLENKETEILKSRGIF